MCQRPCDVHNPCAEHAVCINTNHGSDCSCEEGFQGNGYVGCSPGTVQDQVMQGNQVTENFYSHQSNQRLSIQ